MKLNILLSALLSLIILHTTNAQFVKTPYLILNKDISRTDILFQTDEPQVIIIKYGLTKDYEIASAQISQQKQGKNENIFKYTFKYLKPGKKYYYKITDKKHKTLWEANFTAQRSENDSKIFFTVINNNANNLKIREIVSKQISENAKREPKYQSFILHTGNIAPKGNNEKSIQKYYYNPESKHFMRLQSEIPIMRTRGNADMKGKPIFKTQENLMFKYFPYDFEEKGKTYYHFNYGIVSVIVLDQFAGYTPSSKQYQWVKKVLTENKDKQNFVLVNSTFSDKKKTKKYNSEFAKYMAPLFDEFEKVIVFSESSNSELKTTGKTGYFYLTNDTYISVKSLGEKVIITEQNISGEAQKTEIK